MADRLSQLQDAVNVQAENLCNSIGLLQQCARPSPFPEFANFNRSASRSYQQVLLEAGISTPETNKNNETTGTDDADQKKPETNGEMPPMPPPLDPEEHSKLFAKLITKTAKDIDQIIDSLPSRDMEPDLQEAHAARLETENLDDAEQLETVIGQTERLLDVIKEALQDIAHNQMVMRQLETQMLTAGRNHQNDLIFFHPSSLSNDNSDHHDGQQNGDCENSTQFDTIDMT